jgi:uncharacterized protein YuzE
MIQARQVQVEYDTECDILYLIVGKPASSESVWVDEDVYLRKDIMTYRIKGNL